MSRYHGTKLSGSQQSFLKRRLFSLSNDGRKLWVTVLFLSAIMHRKVIHVNCFRLFLPYFRTTVCLDSEILLPWQRDVTASPHYSPYSL